MHFVLSVIRSSKTFGFISLSIPISAKTIFAPTYKFYVYEGEVKVRDIRDTILSKEKDVINSHQYEEQKKREEEER